MKKLILILTTAIIATFTTGTYTASFETTNTAFAENNEEVAEETTEDADADPAPEGTRLEDMTFDVQEYLRLDDDQETEYFAENDETPPIVSLILRLIEFATIIIGSIATILIIAAGFLFMISRGNEQKLTEAKDLFKYAIIGLAIAFLSYTIVLFVQSLFT